ncbi:hypothetical protein HMPREF1214_01948 [Bacteroides sp. HPS0048]|nr:hypothetical protein HMPREF1214_01948 [Bacteroides sp. HPS0048]
MDFTINRFSFADNVESRRRLLCCKNEEGICWRVDGVDKVDADERLLKGPSEVPGIQLYLLSS